MTRHLSIVGAYCLQTTWNAAREVLQLYNAGNVVEVVQILPPRSTILNFNCRLQLPAPAREGFLVFLVLVFVHFLRRDVAAEPLRRCFPPFHVAPNTYSFVSWVLYQHRTSCVLFRLHLASDSFEIRICHFHSLHSSDPLQLLHEHLFSGLFVSSNHCELYLYGSLCSYLIGWQYSP